MIAERFQYVIARYAVQEQQRESVIPEQLAEPPATDADAESPTGCVDAPCEGKAGTDASVPEKRNMGHDAAAEHGKDDVMPIAEAVEWLRPWWQRGVNFAVREEGVWLLLRGETAQQASRCLEEVKAAWPAICAALDIPEETSLCGWRRAEG